MAKDLQPVLRIRLRNQRPVELSDFSIAMLSIAQHYENYALVSFGEADAQTSLYISKLRNGSIIAELAAISEQVSFIIEHRDIIAGFYNNVVDLANFFLRYQKTKISEGPSVGEAKRIANIFEPVAKDGGSNLTIQIVGNVSIQQTFNSADANTIQNNIRRYTSKELPASHHFHAEPLTLFQVRGDATTHAGDRGVIQKFSEKPVRLYFMSEDAKRAILDHPENPFQMIFIVDGEVGYSGDAPVIYKIHKVIEAFDKSGFAA